MSVTKNFVILVALGAVVTYLAWRFGGSYVAMFIFWNALISGLLFVDFLITPGKKHFRVRRNEDDTLYFQTENEIEFFVKNSSRHALNIQAKDERVRHFNLPDNIAPTRWVSPREESSFIYDVVPSKRGSFAFKQIFLRWTGLLGLCVKYAKFSCSIEYKVYPNVRDLSMYRLMLQKNRLLPQGDKNIKNYGMGYEFESLRPYVEGDDYRRINWRATARESKLIVNKYQIERNQPVYILLDIGRPMSYPVGGYKKLDYAINAALILADIVNQSGDKAGLMVFDSGVQSHIAPGQGAAHRNQLMETLYHVEDNRRSADFGGAFRALCDKQKRRSLVFIFTDFELPEEATELISQILYLKKRHLPIIVFMENESLNKMADAPARTKNDKILRDTAREFQAERRGIFRKLSAMGIPNVESKAEEFAAAAVNRYIQLTV
ncbi:MAG: DUF58 domain-containing protein [Defluviitaleaceae bacterium]|nr:DUF58 domain-containing protein [Defluviitaleaceae bacterium]